MLRRSSLAVAVALALVPVTGYGLGLGQIRSSSGLNQPFEGEIDLQSVPADDLAQVKVRLAPADAHARAGVELSGALGRLSFSPFVRPNGQPAIRVSSREPIREPYLNFLIEVEWPQGKSVKEYTVLLDPPIFTERRAARVQPAQVERPRPETPPAPPPREPRKAPEKPAAAPSPVPVEGGEQYGRVRRGETLWSIAEKTKPAGVSTYKAVAAIYAANPKAFIRGDINKLKAGVELRLPTPAELGAMDVPGARRDYLEKVKETGAGDAGRPGKATTTAAGPAPAESADRLRLLAPKQPAEPVGTPAPAVGTAPRADVVRQELLLAQEKAESALQTAEQLQSRVADMEGQLRDMQRLVLLKDEQLAQLQRQAAMAAPAVATVPAPVLPTPAEPVVTGTPTQPAVAEPVAERPAAPPTPAEPAAEKAPAPAAAPVPPVGAPAAPPVAAVAEPAPAPELQPVEAAPKAPTAPAEPPSAPPVVAVDENAKEPAKAPPVAASPPAPAPAAAAPAAQPAASGLAAILQDPASQIGVGIAGIGVLGALLWAIAGRRRKGAAATEPTDAGPAADVAASPVPEPMAAPAAVGLVEETAARKEPAPAGVGLAAAAAAGAAVVATPAPTEPDRVSTEDLAALELSTTDLFGLKGDTTEVDPTEEADVYIAYGRYEQAEQLLRLALEMEPGRTALRHKLLEVYFASRDSSAFGALFREMQAAGLDVEDAGAWQRALRMGRQLNPGDSAFAGQPLSDQDLEAALDEAEKGLAADLELASPDLGALTVDTGFSEAAPDLDGGSVLNDLSLDMGTEELADKGTHPFNLEVGDEVTELRGSTSLAGELDDNDMAKAGGALNGFALDDLTGQELERAEDRPPDLSGIELTLETGTMDQDTTLMRADTTLELVDDVETKLDLARAYIELGDGEGARVMLKEVLQEGNDLQKASAEAMLKELV